MKKLKFAIVGCGRISYKHVQALIDNKDEAELVAVCDAIKEHAEEKKKQYEEAIKEASVAVYDDEEEMYSKEDIDVVAICTESGNHYKNAIKALHKNKHILIEKPMAMNLEDIDEINQLAEEKNCKVTVCHQNRFNPPIQNLRRAIEEGRFGKIINGTARILWCRDQHYYDLAPWRGTREMDGGTLMNQCIHNIDLLLWMMDSDVIRVKSETSTNFRKIEMENYGAAILRFESGAIGIIEGTAVVYPKNLEETLSIFGEKGTAVIGGLAVNEIKTWQFADKKDYDDLTMKDSVDSVYGNGHTPLYKDMIDAIQQDRKPYITGEDARKSVEVILQIYKENHQI